MRIYFDSTRIADNSIIGLHYDASTHTNNFTLGSTVCKCFELDIINSAFTTVPTNVYLKDDSDNTLAVLYVDEVNEENLDYTSFTLTDYMLKTDFNYTAENETVNTILTTALGSHWDSLSSYYGLDIQVNQEVNVRDLIGYLAELNGGYAYIDDTDKVRITYYTNLTGNQIEVARCSSFTLGEYHKIGRVYVELADATYYYPSTTTDDTVYLNPNNILIGDYGTYTIESILQHIQGIVDGFEFYNISVDNMPITDIGVELPDAGRIVNFVMPQEVSNLTTQSGDNLVTSDNDQLVIQTVPVMYQTIWQSNLDYNGNWVGGFKLDLNTEEQQETEVTVEDLINNVTIKVDRQNGVILQQIANTNNQVSQLIQDASGLTGYFSSASGAKYIRLNADGIQVSKTTDDGSVNITEDGVYILNDQQKKVASMKENEFDTTNWVYSETREGKCLNIYKRRAGN